jgi:hypothetical protein
MGNQIDSSNCEKPRVRSSGDEPNRIGVFEVSPRDHDTTWYGIVAASLLSGWGLEADTCPPGRSILCGE